MHRNLIFELQRKEKFSPGAVLLQCLDTVGVFVTCKSRPRYDLQCVWREVKPYSLLTRWHFVRSICWQSEEVWLPVHLLLCLSCKTWSHLPLTFSSQNDVASDTGHGERLHQSCAIFTALHEMQTRSSDENSVCLFVRHTRALWQNGRKICPDLYIIRNNIYPTFLRRRMVGGGGDPFYVKFWVNRPPLERNRRFSTNNRSAVTPSEKSSINANRKSTTRFPMSLRWSSYVVPKSLKGGLKNAKRPIFIKTCTSLEQSLLQSFFVWKMSAAKL